MAPSGHPRSSSGLDRASGDEAALIQTACSGDESAFATLVDRYGPMVLSIAYASTLNRADAEDIAQETFLTAWRGLRQFRADASFSTWLYEIARSRCVDRARRAATRPEAVRVADPAEPAGSATSDYALGNTAISVLDAAADLPIEQRQAVLMRDVQGLSYDEIAAAQGVPLGTVRSRIATGRARIADVVGEP